MSFGEDKKDFEWHLIEYSEEAMGFQIDFDNVDYISMEKSDDLEIIFRNTQSFLQPKDPNVAALPDPYEIGKNTPQ